MSYPAKIFVSVVSGGGGRFLLQCAEVCDLLSNWIDGDVKSSNHLQIRLHLSGCSQCKGEARELMVVLQMIRSLPKVPPPPSFHLHLQSRLVFLKE